MCTLLLVELYKSGKPVDIIRNFFYVKNRKIPRPNHVITIALFMAINKRRRKPAVFYWQVRYTMITYNIAKA